MKQQKVNEFLHSLIQIFFYLFKMFFKLILKCKWSKNKMSKLNFREFQQSKTYIITPLKNRPIKNLI